MKNITEDEIVNEVFRWFTEESEEVQLQFVNTPKESLIQYHSTLGRSIRNRFKLWENPWEVDTSFVNGIEVDGSPNHPDEISMRVIEKVWSRANYEVANGHAEGN